MDEQFKDIIIETIRDFREEMNINYRSLRDELRDFKKDVRADLKAVNKGIKGILGLLEMQQDVSARQGEKIDGLERRLEELEDKYKGMEH